MDTSKAAAADCIECGRRFRPTDPENVACSDLCNRIYLRSVAAALLGSLGGKAGRGEAKRRGDSAYYKALRSKIKTYKATLKSKTVRVTIPED